MTCFCNERVVSFQSEIAEPLGRLRDAYGAGQNPLMTIKDLAVAAYSRLKAEADLEKLGKLGHPEFGERSYIAFRGRGLLKENRSRPLNGALFDASLSPTRFGARWDDLASRVDRAKHRLDHPQANAIVYQAVQSVASCYDVWQPASVKTPGTFYEIVIGSLFGEVTGLARGKQISCEVKVAGEAESVNIPTDIVLKTPGKAAGIVVAAKTSTRERISQVFVQQKLLEAIFGEGVYRSMLVSVSEIQHIKGDLQETCVPGQVNLYQTHIAKLLGLFYLDPPFRYLTLSKAKVIPVQTVGDLLGGGLQRLIEKQ